MESYASPLICLVYFPPHNGFESHSLCWDINSLSLSIAVISNYMTIAKFVFFFIESDVFWYEFTKMYFFICLET